MKVVVGGRELVANDGVTVALEDSNKGNGDMWWR